MYPQTATPLLTALTTAAQRDHAAFYAPGHKRGQGASPALQALVGRGLQADLPELPELDNLFAPTGAIAAAQELAAQAFGAEATYFLANGSTCGLEAALLAVSEPGSQVLIPRNAHQSVFAGLVLAGAAPIYLAPLHDDRWDLAFGVTVAQIEQAFQAYPDIQTVVVVSPSYHGVCVDIAAIARCVHQHNAVLIVDEAHGAHLGWHPDLPQGAIAAGADIVVQSTHKTLGAMTQASMLHVQGQRVNRDRLRQALQLTQSTSPNYLLLASLDAARQQLAMEGTDLLGQTLAIAQQIRSDLQPLTTVTVLSPAHLPAETYDFRLDPTRLVVDVSGLGLTGFAADEFLHEQQHVTAELPTLRQLAFILSLGNRPEDGDRLAAAFAALVRQAEHLRGQDGISVPALPDFASPSQLSQPPLTPREAFFARAIAVPLEQAAGQIAADALCPYPPGIPLVLAGERMTAAAIATLQQIHQAGGVITGNPDDTWQTVRVIHSGSAHYSG
ncbi:aminotransferase class I/II-fold pyridoxal phosphate-dependent enzyme [Leptolyngbya iicbica]|uniref:Aminotransferase class I/II-fold pyridoxal phosphate-dependent enzyme n=2 Tax=Cyanophyceae TaxID=3028117 RepID=A0A4Q7E6J1_9CYAN|nr:aminotransferase class I/II-fold pyridoxal phosphate-dependent enzyme [Leptolyngbya sp. LK]RZM77858.1 aminotransferase class I/II-fold pyridoxal phosphate-dependent enzyme [Leptolyngbya sp. LK]